MNLDLEDIYKRKSIHDLLDFFLHWSESSVPVSDEEFDTKSEIEKNVYLIYEKLYLGKKSPALFRLIQNSIDVEIIKDFDIKSNNPTLEVISNYKFQDFRPRIKHPEESNLSCRNRILFLLPEYEKIMDNFLPFITFLESCHLEETIFRHKDLSREDFVSGFYKYEFFVSKISFNQDMTCAIVLDGSRKLFCKHPDSKRWFKERLLIPPARDYLISDNFGAINWKDR